MQKEFTRVRSIKDISLFTSLITAGLVLIVLPTGAGVNITGFFMIFAGLILSMVMRTGYKDIQTGERYFKKELYFQQQMKADLAAVISSRPDSADLSKEGSGNALRLDVFYSKTAGKAYIQLFEYVPYKYESCSRLYEYEIGKVSDLIR